MCVLTISISLIMKFLSQSWREVGKEIVFYKTVVKKIRNYFVNKRNKYVPLRQKSKKDYFANLNEKNITDNNPSEKISVSQIMKTVILWQKTLIILL